MAIRTASTALPSLKMGPSSRAAVCYLSLQKLMRLTVIPSQRERHNAAMEPDFAPRTPFPHLSGLQGSPPRPSDLRFMVAYEGQKNEDIDIYVCIGIHPVLDGDQQCVLFGPLTFTPALISLLNQGGFREASTRVLGSESQILSLSVKPHDRSTFRIACGTYDQRIHVFTTDEHWELHSVYSVELQSCCPASIAFNGNGKGDILVFGRDDGVM